MPAPSAGVAQQAEQPSCKRQASGSNPLTGSCPAAACRTRVRAASTGAAWFSGAARASHPGTGYRVSPSSQRAPAPRGPATSPGLDS
jgi:hypothetical protein